MSGVHVYQCPLCRTFSTSAYRLWLSHLGQVHRNDYSFRVMCGYHGCAETKNSYSSLYSHVYRRHPELIRKRCQATCGDEEHFPSTYETTDDTVDSELSGEDFQRLMGTDVESQRRSSALFLLKLKEKRRLTQTAIDDVVEGARLLFSQTAQRIRAGINEELAKNAVEIDISSIFTNLVDPFQGLETQFLQEKYFVDKFGLIEPEEIKLGNPYYEQRFTGHKRQVTQRQDSFHYIPILSSLKALLKDTGVLEQVLSSSSRVRTDGIVSDFCDGQLFHKNPLFSSSPSALQIIAYYDELEICNPLGAYVKKHKLGVVAFSLGNIHPKYRSSLRTISLVSLATVPLIEKYGIDEILRPFVNDLNVLSTVGINVDVNGVEHTFKGGLLTFLGDTLALHEVGGFKCSVSRAFRICRTCMATNTTASMYFNSKYFEKRSDTNHRQHCEAIDGPLSEHYSVAYGVVRRSILLDVNCYYMFEGGLPHDIMHDLYEGVVQYEMKLLLTYLVDKNLLTIQEFNKRLINFDYGYSEVADKPTPITRANFKSGDKKLRQGASQCMLLSRILPLLLVDCFDDDDPYWECYLCLLKIINICLSPMVTMDMCATLKVLIEEHHTRFHEVYPEETIIPKMHYMCHYPEQILQVGPLTNSWTMRHEGRLHVLKQAAHLGNYKNITLTLCRRQQRWICYEMATGSILSPTLECGPGPSPTTLASEPPSRQNAISLFLSEVSADTTVFKPAWVKKQGILFKNKDCYVVIGCTTDGEPHFGRLDEIIVLASGLVLFVLSPCTSFFDLHLHAYCVTLQANQILQSLDNLKDHSVYHGHKTGNNLYIIPKYNIVV